MSITRSISSGLADVILLQRQCSSANEYLSFCNAFYEELAEAVKCEEYPLYDEQAGEEEKPYTTAYFAILVEVILSRCRTSKWVNDAQDVSPTKPDRPAQSLTSAQRSEKAKPLGKGSLKPLKGK
jgi:hypothetical protein